MSFSKLTAGIFGVAFIIILYVIIYYALKIMYKDVKNGGRRKSSRSKKSYGIEVVNVVEKANVKKGSVIPVKGAITIGRKDENSLVLKDSHVSGTHARFVIKNNVLFIEDLNSTNGVYVNGRKIEDKAKLFAKDEIRIGDSSFRVL